jgi:hypothetical protein
MTVTPAHADQVLQERTVTAAQVEHAGAGGDHAGD